MGGMQTHRRKCQQNTKDWHANAPWQEKAGTSLFMNRNSYVSHSQCKLWVIVVDGDEIKGTSEWINVGKLWIRARLIRRIWKHFNYWQGKAAVPAVRSWSPQSTLEQNPSQNDTHEQVHSFEDPTLESQTTITVQMCKQTKERCNQT